MENRVEIISFVNSQTSMSNANAQSINILRNLAVILSPLFPSFIRFCHNVFDGNYKATIGVDFEMQRFDVLGTPLNLQM